MDALRTLLEHRRTTALGIIAITGALRDPANITFDQVDIILLAIGLILAADAKSNGRSKTDG